MTPPPLPYLTKTGGQLGPHQLSHYHEHIPAGLFRRSAFGTWRAGVFQIVVARYAHRHLRAPAMGPVSPGNTACVCRAAQALPAGTPSCHHHGGPAAIWPIVLIARHLHLAEIALGLFWCPILPVVVAADDHLPGRGRLPPARVTTTPPLPNGPATLMQRPGNGYNPS